MSHLQINRRCMCNPGLVARACLAFEVRMSKGILLPLLRFQIPEVRPWARIQGRRPPATFPELRLYSVRADPRDSDRFRVDGLPDADKAAI